MRTQALPKPRPVRPRRLSVMFVVTTLDLGGAETLLDNLVRRLDPEHFAAGVCCTKTRGPIGECLAESYPVHEYRLKRKWDLRVVAWMKRRLREQGTDIVVTVGAGDKMFWGRLAARLAKVPVVISALHTTGWPDSIGRLNRLLTPLNDAFVGVAPAHALHLVEQERLPANKVFVIPNGIDAQAFQPRDADERLRASFGISAAAPVAGIVARLGVEKNHEMFLRVAQRIRARLPGAHFLVIGDGPRRKELEALASAMRIGDCVHFTGARRDVPQLLSLLDVFLLTSLNEASPVSVLEAMSSGTPVVATDVGSVSETVIDGQVGYLVPPNDDVAMSERAIRLLADEGARAAMGQAARKQAVSRWSVANMVQGYEQLMLRLWSQKLGQPIARTVRLPLDDLDEADRLRLIDI